MIEKYPVNSNEIYIDVIVGEDPSIAVNKSFKIPIARIFTTKNEQ
jgi:hypothetical protein